MFLNLIKVHSSTSNVAFFWFPLFMLGKCLVLIFYETFFLEEHFKELFLNRPIYKTFLPRVLSYLQVVFLF